MDRASFTSTTWSEREMLDDIFDRYQINNYVPQEEIVVYPYRSEKQTTLEEMKAYELNDMKNSQASFSSLEDCSRSVYSNRRQFPNNSRRSSTLEKIKESEIERKLERNVQSSDSSINFPKEGTLYPSAAEIACIPEIDIDKLLKQHAITKRSEPHNKLLDDQIEFEMKPMSTETCTHLHPRKMAVAITNNGVSEPNSKPFDDGKERNRDDKQLTIEISPGVIEKLRCTEETRVAYQMNNVVTVDCMICTQEMICISDAEYVLCPVCKSVSCLGSSGKKGGGVGVGQEVVDRSIGELQ